MVNEKRSTPPQLGKVLAKATTSVVNLSVAGAAAAGAAAFHSWPILAVGGAAYAALVAWDMVTPEFWRKALTASRAARLPSPEKLSDPAARNAVRAMISAEAELSRVLLETPEDVKRH